MRSMMELTEHSSGQTVTLQLREPLRLTLPETPTTGYRWQMLHSCEELTVESDTAEAPSSPPGAAGRRVWLLRAARAGSCKLELQLRRSWESESAKPALAFIVNVEKA